MGGAYPIVLDLHYGTNCKLEACSLYTYTGTYRPRSRRQHISLDLSVPNLYGRSLGGGDLEFLRDHFVSLEDFVLGKFSISCVVLRVSRQYLLPLPISAARQSERSRNSATPFRTDSRTRLCKYI